MVPHHMRQKNASNMYVQSVTKQMTVRCSQPWVLALPFTLKDIIHSCVLAVETQIMKLHPHTSGRHFVSYYSIDFLYFAATLLTLHCADTQVSGKFHAFLVPKTGVPS